MRKRETPKPPSCQKEADSPYETQNDHPRIESALKLTRRNRCDERERNEVDEQALQARAVNVDREAGDLSQRLPQNPEIVHPDKPDARRHKDQVERVENQK